MSRWEQIKRGLRTFLSTGEEWHSFVTGLCEILCPWPPRCTVCVMPYPNEYHYYAFGRALGVIIWILLAKLIQAWFW